MTMFQLLFRISWRALAVVLASAVILIRISGPHR